MREEENQVSRLLSVQVCNILLSLIPFLDIEIKNVCPTFLYFTVIVWYALLW